MYAGELFSAQFQRQRQSRSERVGRGMWGAALLPWRENSFSLASPASQHWITATAGQNIWLTEPKLHCFRSAFQRYTSKQDKAKHHPSFSSSNLLPVRMHERNHRNTYCAVAEWAKIKARDVACQTSLAQVQHQEVWKKTQRWWAPRQGSPVNCYSQLAWRQWWKLALNPAQICEKMEQFS